MKPVEGKIKESFFKFGLRGIVLVLEFRGVKANQTYPTLPKPNQGFFGKKYFLKQKWLEVRFFTFLIELSMLLRKLALPFAAF